MRLDKGDHRSLVLWATDCAEHVLPYFGIGLGLAIKHRPFGASLYSRINSIAGGLDNSVGSGLYS